MRNSASIRFSWRKPKPAKARPTSAESSSTAPEMGSPSSPTSSLHKRQLSGMLPQGSELTPTSMALSQVLKNEQCRALFRTHLEAQHMEESLDCYDAIERFESEVSPLERVALGRNLIREFCLDDSPRQVNLSSINKTVLSTSEEDIAFSVSFFDKTKKELLKDIRQSDAFRFFLEAAA
jgi:hypothetical protein